LGEAKTVANNQRDRKGQHNSHENKDGAHPSVASCVPFQLRAAVRVDVAVTFPRASLGVGASAKGTWCARCSSAYRDKIVGEGPLGARRAP